MRLKCTVYSHYKQFMDHIIHILGFCLITAIAIVSLRMSHIKNIFIQRIILYNNNIITNCPIDPNATFAYSFSINAYKISETDLIINNKNQIYKSKVSEYLCQKKRLSILAYFIYILLILVIIIM